MAADAKYEALRTEKNEVQGGLNNENIILQKEMAKSKASEVCSVLSLC